MAPPRTLKPAHQVKAKQGAQTTANTLEATAPGKSEVGLEKEEG